MDTIRLILAKSLKPCGNYIYIAYPNLKTLNFALVVFLHQHKEYVITYETK